MKVTPKHLRPPVGIASLVTTLLSPVAVGILVGWDNGVSLQLGIVLLLFAVLMPHLMLIIYGIAFGAGKLLGIVGAKHVAFYVFGGMVVAWLFFFPLYIMGYPRGGSDPIHFLLPKNPLDGLIRYSAAGAFNGFLYWRISRMCVHRIAATRMSSTSNSRPRRSDAKK